MLRHSCSQPYVWWQVGSQGSWRTVISSRYCFTIQVAPLANAIPQLNTSTLGHNIIPTTGGSSTPTTPSVGSILGSIVRDTRNSISGGLGGELDSIVGDVADQLTTKLGIKEWYSMHVMNMCEGMYTPNATASSARLNVSTCTTPRAMCMQLLP